MSARCPTCGASIPAAGEPCPACLMKLAMGEAIRDEASREADAGSIEAHTRLGSGIGPYTLRDVLGEGGMGVVYLAEQTEPIRRRVAVKVIKIGMDSREVLARFDVERRTLALLDHPNIARVIDAGSTPGGRPYFVMEYVDGVPITDYCDSGKLDVGQRIELFLAVCEAIQHAHLKGVIHRDLKPGNVLVTEADGRPVPKVIDFGLAKATQQRLTERTAFTRLGRLIGTPEYMSPEQAGLADGDVDTRTDLYSLGVLLYEILAGAPPLDSKALREAGLEGLLRQIREAPSPRPSVRLSSLGEAGAEIARNRGTDPPALTRRLQGELDWVVMKAIEKDRDRRYATVRELAAELRRYLNHEPVVAGPPGAAYRVGKFVRRHRIGVAASGAILAALVLGVVGTSIGWSRAVRARRLAAQEAETTRQVNAFLTDLFEAARPADAPPESITAPAILEAGAQKIREELSGQPLIQAQMMAVIGSIYLVLDLHEKAREMLEESLRIRERELPPGHIDLTASMNLLGNLYFDVGRYEEAERLLSEAVAIQDRTLEPDDPRRVSAMINLAALYYFTGRGEEADGLAERAVEIGELATGPGDPRLAIIYSNRGIHLHRSGRTAEAERVLATALELLSQQVGEDHVDWARTANSLAVMYQQQNKLDESITLLRRVAEVQERNLGPVHNDLADSLGNLAVAYAIQGRFDEAAPLFSRVVRIAEELYGPDDERVGKALTNVGNIRRDLGDYAAAETAYRRSIEILERIPEREVPLAMAYGNLAGLRGRMGDDEGSLALHEKALEIRQRVLGDDHPLTAMSLDNVAATLRELGRLDEAEPLFLRALAIREKTLPAEHPYIAKSLHGLAQLYRDQHRTGEAVETFEKAIAMRRSALGAGHPDLAYSLSGLAAVRRDMGELEAAERLFREALDILEAKYPNDHPRMRQTLDDFSQLMARTGRESEARDLESRARSLDR